MSISLQVLSPKPLLCCCLCDMQCDGCMMEIHHGVSHCQKILISPIEPPIQHDGLCALSLNVNNVCRHSVNVRKRLQTSADICECRKTSLNVCAVQKELKHQMCSNQQLSMLMTRFNSINCFLSPKHDFSHLTCPRMSENVCIVSETPSHVSQSLRMSEHLSVRL